MMTINDFKTEVEVPPETLCVSYIPRTMGNAQLKCQDPFNIHKWWNVLNTKNTNQIKTRHNRSTFQHKLTRVLAACQYYILSLPPNFYIETYIKKQRCRLTQYIYIINNVELNSGHHISVTQDHLQALVDTYLILKQIYMWFATV